MDHARSLPLYSAYECMKDDFCPSSNSVLHSQSFKCFHWNYFKMYLIIFHLPTCLCMKVQCPWRPKEGIGSLGAWVMGVCDDCSMWVLAEDETRQAVLSFKSFLQPDHSWSIPPCTGHICPNSRVVSFPFIRCSIVYIASCWKPSLLMGIGSALPQCANAFISQLL